MKWKWFLLESSLRDGKYRGEANWNRPGPAPGLAGSQLCLFLVVVRFLDCGRMPRRGFRVRKLFDNEGYCCDCSGNGDDHEDFAETQLTARQFRHQDRPGNAAEATDPEHPCHSGGTACCAARWHITGSISPRSGLPPRARLI